MKISTFEANLKVMAHYLNNLSVMDESISIAPELKKKAKDFFVHDKRLFSRSKCGIQFVSHIEMRESILKGLHDDVGHWELQFNILVCARSLLVGQYATRSGDLHEELRYL